MVMSSQPHISQSSWALYKYHCIMLSQGQLPTSRYSYILLTSLPCIDMSDGFHSAPAILYLVEKLISVR